MRRQLPVHSPVRALAVLGSMARALAGDRGAATAEAILAETYGAQSVLLVDTGTTALSLALEGFGQANLDAPVALPAYTCFDVATAALGAGRRVVLYDLDPKTLGPEPASFDRALEERPAVVVVAHLYGFSVNMSVMEKRCREAGSVLLEDAAQGAGGSWDSRPLGSWGAASILSFGRGKGFAAGGGGAILAHDRAGIELVGWARKRLGHSRLGIRGCCALLGQWALGRPTLYALPAGLPFLNLGETVYRPPKLPRAASRLTCQMVPVVLALGGGELRRRRANGQRLLDRACASPRIEAIEPVDGASPGFLRLPALLKDDQLGSSQQAAQLGIARGYPSPLAALPAFRGRITNLKDPFPGAERLARNLITLPTHSLLREADLAAIEAWLSSEDTG